MTHQLTLPDLVKGLGNTIGIFARNAYLVSVRRWRVIGIQVGDYKVFQMVASSTDSVMDIALRFALAEFDFDPAEASKIPTAQSANTSDGVVYRIPFQFYGKTIAPQDFSPAFKFRSDEPFFREVTAESKGIELILYVKQVCGVASEEINKAYLAEVGSELAIDVSNIVALAATGKPPVKVYFKVEDKGLTEDLHFFFDGTDEEFEEFKELIADNMIYNLAKLVQKI